MKQSLGALALVGAVSVFSFAPSLAQTPSGEPIVIGVPIPISGGSAEVGERSRRGAVLAMEEINAKGGILGRPLKLDIQDDKCDPAQGVSAVRKLMSQPEVVVLLGGACSSVVLAAMPIIKGNIAFLTSQASSPAISKQSGAGGNEWMFRTNPPDDFAATTLVDVMVNDHKKNKVVITAQNDEFGRGAADGFKNAVEKAGGSVVGLEYFPVQGPYDFSSIVTKFKARSPEAIIFAGTIESGVPLLKELGTQSLKIPVYGRGLPLVEATFKAVGPALADGIHGADQWYAEVSAPASKEFADKFVKRWGEAPRFNAFAMYEALDVAKAAITAAGSTDRTKIRDAIAKTSYVSLTGVPMKFDAYNQAHNKIYVGRVNCSGSDCKVTVVGDRILP